MGRYAAEFNRTASTTLATGSIVSDSATAARRGKLYDLMFGSEDTPADNAFRWIVGRITAEGTNTPVTARPLDPADAAFLGKAGETHTVDATFTAGVTLLSIPLNQRASYRWVAAPGGELVYPATDENGLGIKTAVGSAVLVTATAHWEEC